MRRVPTCLSARQRRRGEDRERGGSSPIRSDRSKAAAPAAVARRHEGSVRRRYRNRSPGVQQLGSRDARRQSCGTGERARGRCGLAISGFSDKQENWAALAPWNDRAGLLNYKMMKHEILHSF